MPVTKSAKKALRKDRRRAIINKRVKKHLKEAINTFKKNPTEKNYRFVCSVLDQTAKKKVIHKNKAARLKACLAKRLKKPPKTQETPTQRVKKVKK